MCANGSPKLVKSNGSTERHNPPNPYLERNRHRFAYRFRPFPLLLKGCSAIMISDRARNQVGKIVEVLIKS
jgi:hypothetical protein